MAIEWNSAWDGPPQESGTYLVAKHVTDDYRGDPVYDLMIGFYSKSEGLWYIDSDDVDKVFQAYLEHIDPANVLGYISHWAEIPKPPEDDRC